MREVQLLICCALLCACVPQELTIANPDQELRIDNLNWDIQPAPIHRETAVRHSRPKDAQEHFDPQEYDPSLTSVFVEADAITERLVGNVARDEDFGSSFWAMKKRLLLQEYGIDWRSPAELNPDIEYGKYGQRKLNHAEKSNIRAIVLPRLESELAEVYQIERTFAGEVWAWAGIGDERYLFSLDGHQNEWEVVDFWEIQY